MRLIELPWLEARSDLAEEIKAAQADPDLDVATLRRLASCRLNLSAHRRLHRLLAQVRTSGDVSPLATKTLGVIGHGTLDLIQPVIEVAGVRHGLDLHVHLGPFDQPVQALGDAGFTAASPDYVLVALQAEPLGLAGHIDVDEAVRAVDRAIGLVESIRNAAASDSVLLWQTIPPSPMRLLGSADGCATGSGAWEIDAVNRHIVDGVRDSSDVLVDVAHLAASIGVWEWHDDAKWHMARLPFSQQLAPLYADFVARTVGALAGKSRRVLVLDLDNTVWGGVIGDDGLDGIRLGEGDPVGEAHLALQRAALALKDRGIAIAVCSKNTEEIARAAFRDHPEMLLRQDDISVFVANWNDKPSNLRTIAAHLNLGLDTLVFVDDNPVERAHVRSQLPEVAVIELGDDPAEYARLVLGAGYFETVAVTDDDRQRTTQFRQNALRASAAKQAADPTAFLRSLEMQASIAPFDRPGRARIAQLLNKSNQFNLTTRRYTEAEVEEVELTAEVDGWQIRLADTFGDNGMVSVVICRRHGTAYDIDTWVMSCRVLGRRLEEVVLDHLVDQAVRHECTEIRGRWIPTERNTIVADHYANLGFDRVEGPGPGTHWVLRPNGYESRRAPIDVNVLAT